MIGHPFLIKTLCFFLKMNGRFAISDNGGTDSGLPVGSFTNFKSPSTYLHGVNSEKSVTSPSKIHSKSRVSRSNSNGMNTSGLLNTSTSKLLQLCVRQQRISFDVDGNSIEFGRVGYIDFRQLGVLSDMNSICNVIAIQSFNNYLLQFSIFRYRNI